MQAAKRQLRKDLKKRLLSLSDDEKQKQSNIVIQKLFQHPKYVASRRISIFLNMNDEVKTYSILQHAFKVKKEVFIPKYVGSVMDMVQLDSMTDYEQLPETSWHIKQPADDDNSRCEALSTGGLDLILMPGLGFTTNGHRLGRGKGYYDSYIDKLHKGGFHPYLLALAFSVQVCNEIPVSEYDKMVDEVLRLDSN